VNPAASVRIALVGTGCPVLPGVTVGVQRGRDVVQEVPADGGEVTWVLDARRVGADLLDRFDCPGAAPRP
jgi:hypothetical protein